MKKLVFLLSLFGATSLFAQTNIIITTVEADNVIKGNYNPATYAPSTVINDHNEIICDLNKLVNPDSLLSYMEALAGFHTRNTVSDTVSQDSGIGAARRWVYGKFAEFSAQNENRLLPAYCQFNKTITPCPAIMLQHRNVLGVLPGSDTTDPSIIVIEAHMDSRCELPCDITCRCAGGEDNASGTVLVIELARVLSKYSFRHTIVFMATIGEDQGLHGADAFAKWCFDNNIGVRAVLNNDIVGGVTCGNFPSAPTPCTAAGQIDSTSVRIFSNPALTGQSRTLARFTKMMYTEKLSGVVDVPMTLHVMNWEDRDGRGGDHQPFSDRGYPAIRFCQTHENDNIQHVAGADSVRFINFNYLARNSVICGVTAALIGNGPETPTFTLSQGAVGLDVEITDQIQYPEYRVGVRTNVLTDFDADYDALYSFKVQGDLKFTIPGLEININYFVSVASVDANGMTSMFSAEKFNKALVKSDSAMQDQFNHKINCWLPAAPTLDVGELGIELMPPYPNPFNKSTVITVKVNGSLPHNKASIVLYNMIGQEMLNYPIRLNDGLNQIVLNESLLGVGVYQVTLLVDGRPLQSQKLVRTR